MVNSVTVDRDIHSFGNLKATFELTEAAKSYNNDFAALKLFPEKWFKIVIIEFHKCYKFIIETPVPGKEKS